MKEATGELNMTLVTVLAVAAILIFVTTFVPRILENISDTWSDAGGEELRGDQLQPGNQRP